MADLGGPVLNEVLGRLAATVSGGSTSRAVEGRMRQMEDAVGPAEPARFTGAPGTELTQASGWMDDAERALMRFGEIENQLPQLQAAADQRSKDARGKWILLAVIGAILLAILIGQLI